MNYSLIVVTFPNREEAEMVSKELLKNRLIACAQFEKIDSLYLWKDEVVCDEEIRVIYKTSKQRYHQLEKSILELHPYEVPQIIEIEIKDGFKSYLNWIKDSIN
jgi:periplasmic divalent cation tolerance protein